MTKLIEQRKYFMKRATQLKKHY